MTAYESQDDSNDAICPYCGNSYQVEIEDYDFDGHAELCDNCGKYYFLESFAEVTHRTSPRCELNGDAHDWEIKPTHMACRVCGKVILLPPK